MTSAVGAGTDRFDVRSPDGTSIAVWVEGDGPPLVMAHGAMSDHTNDRAFVDALRATLTTFAVDRRGRGASGDGPDYSIEREFEDLAAVVDAVAARTGDRVALWGHSYGADCAMGAATRTDRLSHLVLYEPGLGMTYRDGAIEAIERKVAEGDFEGAIVAVLVDVVEITDEEVAFVRSSPTWPVRVATAPTVPRELAAESGWVYRPGGFDAVAARTLLLAGSESPAEQTAATERAAGALPGARIHVLDGHGHIAHRTDPDLVARIVGEFLAT